MNVSLNNYNYSYANMLGSGLKHPLFKLVSNIATASSGNPLESEARRISKVALHCLFAAILIIPAGLAWLVGKAFTHFSKTQLNLDSLHLSPPPIEIPRQAPNQLINLRTLSDRFNQLNLKNIQPPTRLPYLKTKLRDLCDWTTTRNNKIFPKSVMQRDLFCQQLTLYLNGIIKKIETGEISKEKESEILLELAEASTRCYPTWLEVSAKLYAEVHNQVESVEIKLLRFLQNYKESLILEYSQKEADVQWHALNYVRNILGLELGLNRVLNNHDPYAAQNDPTFGKSLTKWLFLQMYENANRLISSIHLMIDSQPYDRCYAEFLIKIVQDQGITDATDYVEEHFYSEDFKLNHAGVNLMLRCIGVVK